MDEIVEIGKDDNYKEHKCFLGMRGKASEIFTSPSGEAGFVSCDFEDEKGEYHFFYSVKLKFVKQVKTS